MAGAATNTARGFDDLGIPDRGAESAGNPFAEGVKAIRDRLKGVGRAAAVGATILVGGAVVVAPDVKDEIEMSRVHLATDHTRTLIDQAASRYRAPADAPLENHVVSRTPPHEGIVRLAGRAELEHTGSNITDNEFIVVEGEEFWLQAVCTKEEGERYFYLMRKQGGARYLGSDHDGGERGAVARFDIVMGAVLKANRHRTPGAPAPSAPVAMSAADTPHEGSVVAAR